jgi:hypothetical protein
MLTDVTYRACSSINSSIVIVLPDILQTLSETWPNWAVAAVSGAGTGPRNFDLRFMFICSF